MTWRIIATRFNGDGTETITDPELPLRDCSFTTNWNAPDTIDGALQPEYRYLTDDEGGSILQKWSTGIYVEEDGGIRAGGILVDAPIDPVTGSLSVSVMGLSGYPNGQPFTEGDTWPPNPYPVDGINPMDAVRKIWSHLQSQRNGDLGVQITGDAPGKKIGRQVAQGEFDTENGVLSFEYEPFLLRDFETLDLGEKLSLLHQNTPLSYRERHEWNLDETEMSHFIDYSYPSAGVRRTDYRLVMGENIDFSAIESFEEEYASEVLGLGAGEGAAMVRGLAYRANETRIRRAIAVEDKAARTPAAIATSARLELQSRIGLDEVTEITVKPSHRDELSGLRPGDTIRLLGETPYRKVDMWVFVQSRTETPQTGALSFAVSRSDRLG